MSKPDNTQELDEILFDLCDLSYASFTTQEECNRVADQLDYDRAKAKQALLDWHNKQIEEVLDRLESKGLNEDGGSRYVNTPDGYVAATAWNEAQNRVEQAIEAERNKLKGSKNDQL